MNRQVLLGVVLLIFIVHMYELKKLIKKLGKKFSSITDHTTLFYNKNFFLKRFEEEIKKAERYNLPLALIMISLNDITISIGVEKNIDESLIKRIAFLLKENMRETDILARFGNNEFACILPFERIEGATIVLERIKNILLQNKNLKIKSNTKKIKIGLALLPEDGKDRDSLIKKAKDNTHEPETFLSC
ncbi:MAG: GGDEF domain-containing protein [bacterium]